MSESERPEDEVTTVPGADDERRQTGNLADEKHPVPLFLRGKSDGRHGDAQDEKDGSAE